MHCSVGCSTCTVCCFLHTMQKKLFVSCYHLFGVSLQERAPPCVDDFLYICDDAYKRSQLIAMEISILHALNFDINIPVPYRFLRRYAKVRDNTRIPSLKSHVSSDTLGLISSVCVFIKVRENDHVGSMCWMSLCLSGVTCLFLFF